MNSYQILKDFAAPAVAFVGVLVTGGIAFAGLKTFNRWKRERLEEKRIDVAIDALAIAFEAVSVFDIIRSRWIRPYEYDEFSIGGPPASERHTLRAVLERVQAQRPFFDKAAALEPRFVAVFGRKATFERLFSARRQVIVTAEAFSDDLRVELDPDDTESRKQARAQHVKWRKQLFASPGIVDEEDEVGKTLKQFCDEIENLCRPIVHHTFNK